jgi:hypothetical protein
MGPPMDEKLRTLSDAEITSQRAVTRRTLLSTLSIGAGVAAAVAAGAHAQTAPTEPKPPPKELPPKRRDPCRDGDHGPPSDGDGCGKPPTS